MYLLFLFFKNWGMFILNVQIDIKKVLMRKKNGFIRGKNLGKK